MQIFINNRLAALKKNTSFEYIAENSLFTGSDSYSLNITFPLKDCPQNLEIFGHINRVDVALDKVVFDCEIFDRAFSKTGSVTVTEISDVEIKCQFLEGRCEANFDKTFDSVYINELDLGSPDIFSPSQISPGNAMSPSYMDYKCVALPWVNNNSDSGQPHNFVILNEMPNHPNLNYYNWEDTSEVLTWQPFLLHIITKICNAVGYTVNLGSLENDVKFKYLIICNTLPGGWEITGFARALPHWTVEEFFNKLGLFLGGEFFIDHKNKSISFSLISETLNEAQPVTIDQVVDESSSEIEVDEEDSGYIESKNLEYKADDSDAWKYYSCRWFVNERLKDIVVYNTLNELIEDNRRLATNWISGSTMRGTNMNRLLYANDVNTYFIVRIVSKTFYSESRYGDVYKYKCILQPVNIFSPRIVNEDAENDAEEIEILPVPVDYTDDEHEFCIYLTPGSFSEPNNSYLDIASEEMSGTQASLLQGSSQSASEYYDCIYIGWWPGLTDLENKMPFPIVDKVLPKNDWSGYHSYECFNMRLTGSSSNHKVINKINSKVKRTFKFLSDSIPDVKAIFYIGGKRYLCEKITATFTENGMSQLLKGEFYPIQ